MTSSKGLLSIKGKNLDRLVGSDDNSISSGSTSATSAAARDGRGNQSSNDSKLFLSTFNAASNDHSKSNTSFASSSAASTATPATPVAGTADNKYWKQPQSGSTENIVVIHVCDENRRVTKDFCCKRHILVKHMEYFDKFLAENENGYDDIDISVHCDVEIFEWLMCFIHEPEKPPVLEKSIVVSILISSEFLQMEALVDICIEHISLNLNDIIKLPIDLSCISERLINKLAIITHPKALAQTKDRKDKILNKLYKRRVELDFSRKSSASKGSTRMIAATLTCCKYCGIAYMESCVSSLVCSSAPAVLEFRGRLVRRHVSVIGWSLTAYLKSLHTGGMSWESIYWHVWAACTVFEANGVIISANETDKYSLEPNGVVIGCTNSSSTATASILSSQDDTSFNLDKEDLNINQATKAFIPISEDIYANPGGSTPSLTCNRPYNVLTMSIFELLCMQVKLISSYQHKDLIENTFKNFLASTGPINDPLSYDFGDVLWTDEIFNHNLLEERRGRSRSPPTDGKKQVLPIRSRNRGMSASADTDTDTDVDSDLPSNTEPYRYRSTSMGNNRRKLNQKPARKNSKPTNAAKGGSNNVGDTIALFERHMDILKGLPSEVGKLVKSKGPVHGLWLIDHPLASHPNIQIDMLNAVQDSSVSESKKLEWKLDVTREYDEKRMDRFETFLTSKRNYTNVDAQLRSRSFFDSSSILSSGYQRMSSDKSTVFKANPLALPPAVTGSYYKDRGRCPIRAHM